MVLPANEAVPVLLGRAREVALITSLLDDVHARGAALVVRGEPGIGKSRLLAEAAGLAHARGMTVLTATGAQSETSVPFAGLHQLLRPVSRAAAGLSPTLRGALDAAFGMTDAMSPEPFRIAMAVLDLLSALAEEAPVLLVVEDAHWLDRASYEVLGFVARRLESDPVVLLAAMRDGYRDAPADAGLPELRLGPLEPAVAGELLAASPHRLPHATRERLLREAAGNPLALVELPVLAGRLGPETTMPGMLPLTDRLERAFAARVSGLPDDTRLLLLVAALAGGDDVAEVVAGATVAAGRAVELDALEPAVQAAIVDLDVRTVRFRHPLMRSAVRQGATVSQQRRVHEALAEILAGDPDRRAWHRAALVRGPHEDVAAELERAGRRARRHGATGEAFLALRRAAELSGDAARVRRLLDAAHVAQEIGDMEAVPPLLREVRRNDPSPLQQVRATWIEAMADPRPLGSDARVLAVIAAAARAGEADDRDLQIDLLWLVAFRAWWEDFGSSARRALVAAAVALGDPASSDARVFAIYCAADPLGHAGVARARLEVLAASGGYAPADARHFGAAAIAIGAFDLGAGFMRVAVETLRAEGRLGYLARMLSLYGLVTARRADWDVALPAAEESLRLATEFGEPLTQARAGTTIAAVAGMRGDADAARRAAADAERIATALGAQDAVALAQFGPVLALLGGGDYARAFELAERLFDPADPAYHLPIACWLIGDLAEAAVHAGRAEEGRARVAQVEALAGPDPAVWIAIGLRHARALLAETDEEAERCFRDALDADLGRWPFPRARLLLAHGQWLRRRRRVAESRVPLRAARDTFDALGCAGWSDVARRALRASGETSRRRDPAARDQLTAQELQIAQLAAEGLSNRAIGERLYLSPRTIGTHLYRVFPKLGITARGELAAALRPPEPAR